MNKATTIEEEEIIIYLSLLLQALGKRLLFFSSQRTMALINVNNRRLE